MRDATKLAMSKIMDCFTGADGGISYVQFRSMIETCDKKAEAGDKPAEILVGLMIHFSRMIEAAERSSTWQ